MTEPQASLIRKTVLSGLVVLGFAQVIFHPDLTNFSCVMIVLAMAFVMVTAMVRADVLRKYPISSLQLIGFWIATQSLALFATTIQGIPLINNLKQPVWTFCATSLTCVALLVAHLVYRYYLVQAAREFLCSRVNMRLDIFRKPKPMQVWLIGLVGLLALIAARVSLHAGAGEVAVEGGGGGALYKLALGLSVFSAAPFMLPILKATERKDGKLKMKDFLLPGLYFVVVIAIGLASNARSVIFAPIVTIITATAVLICCGYFKITAFKSPLWMGAGLVALLSIGTLTDFAMAMQKARERRGMINQAQMLALSLEIYSDPELLKRFKEGEERARMLTLWDEVYTSNIFLNRFISTKFHDLGFGLESKLNPIDRRMLGEFTESRMFAIYPAPIVNLLPFRFKKSSLSIVSNGDFMFFLATGTGLGTFRTGSVIAQCYAIWGPWAFPALGLTGFFIFLFADSLVLSTAAQARLAGNKALMPVSFVALMSFYIFNIFQNEAYDVWLSFILRGFWQSIILYAALFWGTSLLTGKLRSTQRKPPFALAR